MLVVESTVESKFVGEVSPEVVSVPVVVVVLVVVVCSGCQIGPGSVVTVVGGGE